MFLSKRNGIYYLWYEDENGRRHKVSTRHRQKKAALEFFQSFRWTEATKPAEQSATLSEFYSTLRVLLTSTHRVTTVEIYSFPLRHLLQDHVVQGQVRTGVVIQLAVDWRRIVEYGGKAGRC